MVRDVEDDLVGGGSERQGVLQHLVDTRVETASDCHIPSCLVLQSQEAAKGNTNRLANRLSDGGVGISFLEHHLSRGALVRDVEDNLVGWSDDDGRRG